MRSHQNSDLVESADHETMRDLFMDDIEGVFDAGTRDEDDDDDDDDDAFGLDATEDDDIGDSNENGEGKGNKRNGGSSDINEQVIASSTPSDAERSRRNIERDGNDNGPPPSWHSGADRNKRQTMILDIARLLRARKKTQPSQEWLQQLPHKARKLEERLYQTASSLEAYLDKRSLKRRLGKLALTISKQFREARRNPRNSVTSTTSNFSFTSMASLASSARSSFASHQGLRDSFSSVGQTVGGMPSVSEQDTTTTQPVPAIVPSLAPGDTGQNAGVPEVLPANGQQSIAALERQKMVNATLQEQIKQSMRQQAELVRKLQGQPEETAGGHPGQGIGGHSANMGAHQGNSLTLGNASAINQLMGASNVNANGVTDVGGLAAMQQQRQMLQRQAALGQQGLAMQNMTQGSRLALIQAQIADPLAQQFGHIGLQGVGANAQLNPMLSAQLNSGVQQQMTMLNTQNQLLNNPLAALQASQLGSATVGTNANELQSQLNAINAAGAGGTSNSGPAQMNW